MPPRGGPIKGGEQVGSWVVERPIAQGGMGRVLLVRHAVTGRQGALKLLLTDGEEDETTKARFRREVEVLGSLEHPAVVGLLDAGERRGEPFLVMEYASGENLENLLAKGPVMARGQALVEFALLADGLRHAHEEGIHHRDIKAENVVMGADGHCMLVDFGVALQQGASRLTNAGHVMGTFTYLAPEVLEGGERDPASTDIYALGQLLCEVLQGKLLFRDDEGRNARQRYVALIDAKGTPLDPGEELPERVRAIVRKATEPEPDDRYRSMAELVVALRAELTDDELEQLDQRLAGTQQRGGSIAAPTRPVRSRLPLVAVLSLVLFGLLACGTGSLLGAGAVLVAIVWR
ncbi:MAG: serine/threonine protein kinase [Alphaproteobacteria bacterium]|nr:serine/threonine protein kinase [Alphaproteobacteria bacterium]